jgi:predicted aspartyl protease
MQAEHQGMTEAGAMGSGGSPMAGCGAHPNGVAVGTGVVLDQMSVRGLRATHVPAALVSELGNIDGLLGMSFLTRFDLLQTGDTLRISTRKR